MELSQSEVTSNTEDSNILGRLFNRLPSPPVNLLSTIVALCRWKRQLMKRFKQSRRESLSVSRKDFEFEEVKCCLYGSEQVEAGVA